MGAHRNSPRTAPVKQSGTKEMVVQRNSPRNSPVKSSGTEEVDVLRNSPVKKSSTEEMDVRRNSTRNSPEKKSVTLQHLFELESAEKNGKVISSPKNDGKDSVAPENDDILSIISSCSVAFNSGDPSKFPSERELKRLKLFRLLLIIKTSKTPLPDQVLRPLVCMIGANLFRPLPPSSNSELPEDEDIVSILSPVWPHLQIVYDILLRLVHKMDPKVLREHIDQPFLANLLALFQSDDPRERDSLKNIYHQTYARFTFYRVFMRKSMNDVFLLYVFGTGKHHGIGELLEVWGSIINGFTVPLKEEHKLFLMRVLIPLHKASGMQFYHRQLAYCISQFVQKEPMLGGIIIRRILRSWPVTNCQKEVLLIAEIEELVENIDPDHYRKLALPLCTQITRCLNSCNLQVAERALDVWNNKEFVKMASSAMEEVFPVVVEGMERNLKRHWSQSVKQLTESVKVKVKDMDPYLYEKCLREIAHKEILVRQEDMKRKEKWERIELQAAAKNSHQFFLPPQKKVHGALAPP